VSDLTGQTRYDLDELISLPSDLPLLRTLQKELSQPTASKGTRMRLVIDSRGHAQPQPRGRRGDGRSAYDSMDWVRCIRMVVETDR
jgi:hypothetical protein